MAKDPPCHPDESGDDPGRASALGRGDFTLESGEVIRDFELSYVTMASSTKPVITPCWLLLSVRQPPSPRFPDRPAGLDPRHNFVVCVDAIGNGLPPPSTSRTQPASFPGHGARYGAQSTSC
jgi:homoserine acetyltransferase